jgi:hypothetical protein
MLSVIFIDLHILHKLMYEQTELCLRAMNFNIEYMLYVNVLKLHNCYHAIIITIIMV